MIFKRQIPLFIVILIALIFFSFKAIQIQNYEFVMYIGVIIFIGILIILTNKKAKLKNNVLWGLVIWAIMHMSGGLLYIKEIKLYSFVLIPLFQIGDVVFLRYDHLVHMFGFGIATLLIYELLKNYLNKKTNWIVFSIILVIAGIGAGALNELIEFIAVVIMPETGVGGYYNTLMDIVSNTIGAIIAVLYINFNRLKKH